MPTAYIPQITVTIGKLVGTAYRLAGITLMPGRTPSTDALQEGIDVFFSLLDSWTTERGLVWAISRQVIPTVANKGDYTIGLGLGADIALPRPTKIEQAGYLFTTFTPAIEQPMDILNYQQWSALSPKGMQSTVAYKLYYEAQVPLGIIHIWPIPTDPTVQFVIYIWQPWTALSAAQPQNYTLILPPGYQRALETSLAMDFVARWPTRAHPHASLPVLATEAKAKLSALNWPGLLMQAERGSGGVNQIQGRYNPWSNSYLS